MAEPARDPGEALRELVARCLERMESEGPAALDALCREHPEHAATLRRRVALLDGLGAIAGAGAQSMPERLGDFRLLRPLGGGGMGVVYLALQESLGREVALKIIRPEQMYLPRARERFRREVETVARLKHPGIVPIYAVGEENGVPYFAMERVHGRSIEAVLESLRAKKPAKLAGRDLAPEGSDEDYLFHGSWETTCLRVVRQVADALAHAHEQGVVHRDVKPSNVMLTADGPSRALLLDFGLATVEGTDRLTRTGAQLGTLHYMSPEQTRGDGDAIGPRSDVYALGVTLYEMLTLQRPFDGRSDAEVLAAIQQGRRKSVRQVHPAISADAETVCLTAIETDPARRYASALDFARDLENVLEHRPIEARRVGELVRAARWMKRHPAGSSAIALALLVVVGGPSVFAWQEHEAGARIRVERDRAEASLQNTLEAVDRMLSRVAVVDLQFAPHMEGTRKRLLEDAVQLLQGLVGDSRGDPRVQVQRAQAQERLGEVLGDLGENQRALDELRGAVAEIEALPAEAQTSALVRELLARCRYHQALILAQTGHADEALAQHALVDDLLGGLDGGTPAGASWEIQRALNDGARGTVLQDLGRRDEAAQCYDRAAAAQQAHSDANPTDRDSAYKLAQLLNERGMLELEAGAQTGLNDAARATFEHALAVLGAAREREPDAPDLAYLDATLLVNLAGVWRRAGDLEQAERSYAEALPLLQRVVADFPGITAFLVELATCANQLGLLADYRGDDAASEPRYREAVEHLEVANARSPGSPEIVQRLGLASFNFAAQLERRGELAAALAQFRRSVELALESQRLFPGAADAADNVVANLQGVFSVANKLGDAAALAAAAEQLAAARPQEWKDAARAAEHLAHCVELARASGASDREAASADYASRAVAALRTAVQRGLPKPAILREMPSFEALHGAPPFEALLAELR